MKYGTDIRDSGFKTQKEKRKKNEGKNVRSFKEKERKTICWMLWLEYFFKKSI